MKTISDRITKVNLDGIEYLIISVDPYVSKEEAQEIKNSMPDHLRNSVILVSHSVFDQEPDVANKEKDDSLVGVASAVIISYLVAIGIGFAIGYFL